MIVGFDADMFRGAMTGVAGYTFRTVVAVMELDASLEYMGFSWPSWRREDLSSFRRFEAVDRQPAPTTGLVARVRSGATSRLSKFDGARALHRYARARIFAASVKSRKLDLFHAFNFRPLSDPGIPVLPVVYDLSAFRHPEFHPAERVRWLEPLGEFVAVAPLVQTISEFSKREIVDLLGYPAERIFVARPAAASLFAPQDDDATARELEPLGLRFGEFFLSVGTLEPRKNIRTLVAAYGRLPPAQRTRCPLVIVGGKGWGDLNLPPQADALQAEGSLRFLGGISNLQLRSLYEGARLFLMPSLYEGFGMPVVEAMACGAPVAYSAGTAMEEIAAGLGHAIPALDVDGWTETLRDVLATGGQADSAARVARIARAQEFSWEHSAACVVDAYRRLIPG